MKDVVDQSELFVTAKEYFNEGQYRQAEPLLNQLILRNSKNSEVFHMLGTIFYDQGKFNKAIRSFKRALEIDPTFTDASVGLSIILNDLGRYEEGQKVFEDAKKVLDQKRMEEDPYVNEKLALKHDELAEMYTRYGRDSEALDQFYKAMNLSVEKAKYGMKIVDILLSSNQRKRAIQLLEKLISEQSNFIVGRLKLGQIFYDGGEVTKAISEWERVLDKSPEHPQAMRLIRQAETAETTKMESTL
tara:strand:- start:212351 stop:213085 length:735 start_codon:yes stop_codon:yes gene_type:complete